MPAPERAREEGYGSHEEHLRDELHRIAGFVRVQLWRFSACYPEAQRERFWHVADDYLHTLAADAAHSPLSAYEPPKEAGEVLEWVAAQLTAIDKRVRATKKGDLRLVRLAREFGLGRLEVDALLLALLPALHSSYRRWYGILQQDPARSFASSALLGEMLAISSERYRDALAVLAPGGRLVRERLLVLVPNDDRPTALRPIHVEDRVWSFLFGIDELDPRLERVARWFDERVDPRTLPITSEVTNRLEMLPNLRAAEPEFLPRLRLQFFGPDPGLSLRAFACVSRGLERRLLAVDVPAAMQCGVAWETIVDCALREARLSSGVPFFIGVGSLYEHGEPTARLSYLLDRLAAFPHPAAVDLGAFETGRAIPGWIPFPLGTPTTPMRERLWSTLLESSESSIPDPAELARDLASAFQLTDSQIREAWQLAVGLARRRNVFIAALVAEDLFAACRQQSAHRLVAFAQRIEPRSSLTLDRDLVLPASNKRALLELRTRIENYARLHRDMALGAHLRLGRGVTALFVGGSGTGKTMAAEVLASEHHVDLYRIDLASLVSKWVGETEKNLSRIFADAERANCMLFFDEADAIFGHRGEVKEARDRWANLEVNYLLQRIEEYSGVVILATNLRNSIDEAFQRRIHVVVEFPPPDAASRRAIWDRLLPTGELNEITPHDLDEIAERFELSGGTIRNVVLDACFRAAACQRVAVTARHIVAGTAREFQKLSRPVTSGDFGRFYQWAMEDVVAPQSPPSSGGE